MWVVFRSAWQEWRHPTDYAPLPIGIDYSNDVIYFAEKFRALVFANKEGHTVMAKGQYQLVDSDVKEMDWANAMLPLVSLSSLVTKTPVICKQPLFVAGNIHLQHGNHFSALFSQGSINVGPGTEIYEWAHADAEMVLGEGCSARRRLSSLTTIELGNQCSFERINAPIVYFGSRSRHIPKKIIVTPDGFFNEIPNVIQRTPFLYMVKGDCILPGNRVYRGSLIVTGCLFIGEGASIFGDVKARMGVVVEEGVLIAGSLISEHRVQILEGGMIRGPVISESMIHINSRSRIGMFELPTTVSAKNIVIEAGSVVHGTVWAREMGIVWSF
ncbi:hypothetical protein ACO0LB_14235 [Undibacterium sp. SXout7W]|uniref:hypothetical protein n=1 Tax=Undibacterium sp. SXout7W TaxID=3413049 RepID=UPI003BF3CAA2